MLSRGSEPFLAASTAIRSLALVAGSAPPLAAMMIALVIFEYAAPRALAFACLPLCFH